jgi:hypothetical protein
VDPIAGLTVLEISVVIICVAWCGETVDEAFNCLFSDSINSLA